MLVVRDSRVSRTVGLAELGHPDFIVPFSDPTLAEGATSLAEFLLEYISVEHKIIGSRETLSWATCILQFDATSEGLTGRAVDLKRDVFEGTADKALVNWTEQNAICSQAQSHYKMTQLAELVVVYQDVGEGGKIDSGTRYPANHPHSGWWLYGANFDGNIESMRCIHIAHVARNHHDAVRYLGLEPALPLACRASSIYGSKQMLRQRNRDGLLDRQNACWRH